MNCPVPHATHGMPAKSATVLIPGCMAKFYMPSAFGTKGKSSDKLCLGTGFSDYAKSALETTAGCCRIRQAPYFCFSASELVF